MTPRPPIAEVLHRWMDAERLGVTEVAQAAGLSQEHVWLIVEGRIARPSPGALRRLARGIATDAATGAVDEARRAAVLTELSAAAWFEDLNDGLEPEDLARLEAAVARLRHEASLLQWRDEVSDDPSLTGDLLAVLDAMPALVKQAQKRSDER